MPNLTLKKKEPLSPFRRMALGIWKTTYDPTVYGSMSLPMDEAERYLKDFREKTGRRITLSHLAAKAMGAVLQEVPDANAILRWGRVYLRSEISVFFQVETRDEETGDIDLTGATIYDPEKKSLLQIVDEFRARVDAVRNHRDQQLEDSRKLVNKVPVFLLHAFLNFFAFLTHTLNLNPKYLGSPRDAFGSVMITNVGSLGLEEAYVPLVPFSRVPLLLALGKTERVPVAWGEEVRIESRMRIFATFDHRILDGAHGAKMAKILRAWFSEPYRYFGAIEAQLETLPENHRLPGAPP